MFEKPRCPLCEQPLQACAQVIYAPEQGCWCQQDGKPFPAALLALVPVDAVGKSCICQHCVQAFYAKQSTAQ